MTALIPAKDEESALPECLASVLSQGWPNLEILIVDDRSTDGTAAVALAIAARDVARSRVDDRPSTPGWTGKTHALHEAARHARGEWLWFLDADTRHEPENLSIVMEYARAKARHSRAWCSSCVAKRFGKTSCNRWQASS